MTARRKLYRVDCDEPGCDASVSTVTLTHSARRSLGWTGSERAGNKHACPKHKLR